MTVNSSNSTVEEIVCHNDATGFALKTFLLNELSCSRTRRAVAIVVIIEAEMLKGSICRNANIYQ